MIAMILAAGRGERLRPLSDVTPKPLIEINHKAIIEYHLEKLALFGFSKVVINVAYLGGKIIKTLGDGSRWNLEIIYSDETLSGGLESGGGIVNALGYLSDTFLVVNGDIMCDYEFDAHFSLGESLAHLLLVKNPPHNKDGDFGIKNGFLTNEREFTFSGIGYYKKALFDGLEVSKFPLAPLLRENAKMITAELYSGKWIDVGTIDRLSEARAIFE